MFDYFQAQHARIELDRLIQVTHAHAGMKKLCDIHRMDLYFRYASEVNRNGEIALHSQSLAIDIRSLRSYGVFLVGPAVLRRSISALPGIRKFGIGPIS